VEDLAPDTVGTSRTTSAALTENSASDEPSNLPLVLGASLGGTLGLCVIAGLVAFYTCSVRKATAHVRTHKTGKNSHTTVTATAVPVSVEMNAAHAVRDDKV